MAEVSHGAAVVVAHEVNKVEGVAQGGHRVRPRGAVHEEVGGKVDGGSEEEGRATGPQRLVLYGSPLFPEQLGEVCHLLGVFWELPVQVEPV